MNKSISNFIMVRPNIHKKSSLTPYSQIFQSRRFEGGAYFRYRDLNSRLLSIKRTEEQKYRLVLSKSPPPKINKRPGFCSIISFLAKTLAPKNQSFKCCSIEEVSPSRRRMFSPKNKFAQYHTKITKPITTRNKFHSSKTVHYTVKKEPPHSSIYLEKRQFMKNNFKYRFLKQPKRIDELIGEKYK